VRADKPAVGKELAERWARRYYGIEARASALPGEVDRNFLLRDDSGTHGVLKVSPTTVAREELECQIAVLQHLSVSEMRGLVQEPLSAEGAPLLEVRDEDGNDCLMRMVSYLEGTTLANAEPPGPALLNEIGLAFGRLDLALGSFEHEGAHRHLVWDITRLPELRGLLEVVESELRPHVEAGLGRFARRVEPHLDALPRSIIHNDANDHNLLVKKDESDVVRLSGILDFGDMVHTITIAELAIACAYAMLDREDPWGVARELTHGYEQARPLSALERRLLPELILGRLCCSLLLSAEGRRRCPDDRYLTISERPVSELLRRLSMEDHDGPHAIDSGAGAVPRRSVEEIVQVRRAHLGLNLSIAYHGPLKIVRGEAQYLFDESGRRYLDLVNNVCHVGHCHPRVVEAGQRQMAALNTNSRYLHDALAEYVVRLAGTLPDPLSVCFLVCTGSEANALALRLARAHTGTREIVILDHAYHGHSPSLIEISPYKCEGPGGEGLAGHAHKVSCPDVYRGRHRGPDAGERYAEEVEAQLEAIAAAGARPGAFMAESFLGCAGQIVPPDGFLPRSYAAVRSAGGVCIADEVQVGFGRAGTHTWAFESLGVVPDIVTLGKPIGNGHPMAAVVTTPEIAASFDTGMEYFNTFGGNPVSCAVGLAVLDVIEEEGLQAHALEMGERLVRGLTQLAERHELIGDVRGRGLFIGVELVRDRESREPAAREADELIEAMKERGFLLSTDGPDHNVVKIKPPMVLGADDIDATLSALDEALAGGRCGRR
jgi:4-aminobutyrate aminotransferase-like enzyme/Ser/Thr protein kinase RdoA (MazF antagonist)